MRFTAEEMVFLNSVSSEKQLFGINIKTQAMKDTGQFVEEVTKKMQDKNIVDSAGKLTKLGIIPIRALELYKNAGEHLIVNNLLLGKGKDHEWIAVAPIDGEYEIAVLQPEVILYLLLQNYPFLCQGMGEDIASRNSRLSYDEWLHLLTSHKDTNLLIGQYKDGNMVSEKSYYWKEEEGYVYDLERKKQRKLHPYEMRKELMELLRVTTRYAKVI